MQTSISVEATEILKEYVNYDKAMKQFVVTKELDEGTNELVTGNVNLKDEKTGLTTTYSFSAHLICSKKFNVALQDTFEYSWNPEAPVPRISKISNRG